METKKCKECGKEISKKAEICPNCGCRVKSNTLKFIIICLVVIFTLVGGYFGIKQLKHNLDENKKSSEKKEKQKANDNVNKKEEKLFESFLGKYQLSYNNELVDSEFNGYSFAQEINIDKKCYFNLEHVNVEEDDIVENCINAIDFETITYYPGAHPLMFHVYKIDNENAILNFQFQNIAKHNESSELMNNRICFKKDSDNNLIQTNCTKRKNGYASYEDTNEIDVKYEFKLTKIK